MGKLLQLGVIVHIGLLIVLDAFTLYPNCVERCWQCSETWGSMYDKKGCYEDCRNSKGASLDRNCRARSDVSKRVQSMQVIECLKYCADCVTDFGKTVYNVQKCAKKCYSSQGRDMDYECKTTYSYQKVFG
ncbi:hypothetical protein FSP39_002204 [Pinctada imbricata]|uniref:Uncharacterized protein n=1 Tax=Pinctada imbricata TaxID=66713 RepID=A0AA88XV28_PINIB|nr:hypothetical protein FSP39_002204 [Pinctada imbricata]